MGRGYLPKAPPVGDILSLRASARWELLGTTVHLEETEILPRDHLEGKKRPQRERSDLRGLRMELQITKHQPE